MLGAPGFYVKLNAKIKSQRLRKVRGKGAQNRKNMFTEHFSATPIPKGHCW